MKSLLSAVLIIIAGLLPSKGNSANSTQIILDGQASGRIFEGLGGVSAGASSRLLIDYPEPQRSEILDFLFKPDYGAGIQHLKVEVGGDVNSTDGSEPSHMHSLDDLNFQRGYEWWLMEEAKKRNPNIILDCLPWGAPGWIGNGTLCTQNMANYIVKFIQGAKSAHGLDISSVGLWNEKPVDPAYAPMLRKTLNANGLKNVRIVAWDIPFDWSQVSLLKSNPAIAAAVAIVGVHYPGCHSTPEAQACGRPLWSSEDGPWSGNWGATQGGTPTLAESFNRNYIQGRMTKTEIWSPITSYYDILPIPGSGLMRANSPWSGHYDVQPAVWMMAHTTQFAQPGWKYMDSACKLLDGGGSVVGLQSPDGHDYSVVIETIKATKPQTLSFQITGGLPSSSLNVWRSDAKDQFIQAQAVQPEAGSFNFTAEPGCIYSLTTTTGQHKGINAPPPAAPFPGTYKEDFENVPPNGSPRYFSDQSGTFDVVPRDDGNGHALRLASLQKGIPWDSLLDPYTILGNPSWKDGTISVDLMIKTTGYAELLGRIAGIDQSNNPLPAYSLALNSDGSWNLRAKGKEIASGKVAGITPGSWHNVKLQFAGNDIKGFIDGAGVADVHDSTSSNGMAGLGSGWNESEFDNLSIQMVP